MSSRTRRWKNANLFGDDIKDDDLDDCRDDSDGCDFMWGNLISPTSEPLRFSGEALLLSWA